MTEWDGATAFITGGAQGIGLGIARALARRGVRLALADVDVAALQTAKAELAGVTPTETYELDVRDREAFADVADKAESTLGPVSLLFNNAGVAAGIPADQMSYAHWDWALGVNVFGVANGIQTFVPRMIERKVGGYVVNTASGAGLVGGPGFLYTTSKFAVVGMSESLRADLAIHRIGVSVLCPGAVDTEIITNTREFLQAETPSSASRAVSETAAAFLKAGVSIDSVGERVMDAIDSQQMWIHTDESMRPFIEMRMNALLASIPTDAAT